MGLFHTENMSRLRNSELSVDCAEEIGLYVTERQEEICCVAVKELFIAVF